MRQEDYTAWAMAAFALLLVAAIVRGMTNGGTV